MSGKEHKRIKNKATAAGKLSRRPVSRARGTAPLEAFYRLLALLLDLALAQLLCEWSSVWWREEAQSWWALHVPEAYAWGLWWAMLFVVTIGMRFMSSLLLGLTPGQWPMGIRHISGNLLLAGLRSCLSTLTAPLLFFHLPLLVGRRSFAEWATGTRLQLNHPWLGRMGLLLFAPMLFVPLLAPIYFYPALWSGRAMGTRAMPVLSTAINFNNIESLNIGPMGIELLLDKSDSEAAASLAVVPFKNAQAQDCLWLGNKTVAGEWCLRQFTPWSEVQNLLSLRNLPFLATPINALSAGIERLAAQGDFTQLQSQLSPLLAASVLHTPWMLAQFGPLTPLYWQMKKNIFSPLLEVAGDIFAQEWGRALCLRVAGKHQRWLVFQRQGMALYDWRVSSDGGGDVVAGSSGELLEQALQGVSWSAPGITSLESFVPFWSDKKGQQLYYQDLLLKEQARGPQSSVLFLRKLMQE